MDLLHLLAFRLRFRREAQFHFFHHAALYAALFDRLGLGPKDPFPPGLALYCPERGRVRYRSGEPYVLGAALHPAAAVTAKRLARALAAPPTAAFARSPRAPFGDTYTIDAVLDAVSGDELPSSASPRPLTLESLRPVAAALAAEREVCLRFLSPLLILRTPVATKEFVMDGEVFQPEKFLARIVEAAAEWWPGAPFLRDLPAEPPAELLENHLIRTDTGYPKKRLLGSSGSVKLRFPNGVGALALPLLLAGVVGVGKAAAMGQGRYAVEGFPLPCAWPPRPAQTLLERAALADNLALARQEMAKAGPAPGVDDVGKDEFLDTLTFEMPRLAAALRSGRLEPAPLRGVALREEKEGREKLRPLAIPTLRDRFLQRAVLQELDPAVEQLLEDSAFAYRKGLSRRTAQRAVDKARQEGYVHVLDADVRAFFDEVDWERLRDRLAAYFGDDPAVDALLAWVGAPIQFMGRTIARRRGLPQGAVVSPLLANLYLDQFDEAIEARGFKLVRYADDFVILAKRREDLKQARILAEAELARLGLELSAAKTRETTFDGGFQFLGSLFCRSLLLDVDRASGKVTAVLDRLPKDWPRDGKTAELSGWLAEAAVIAAPDEDGPPAEAAPARWRASVPPPDAQRRSVYVVSGGVKLYGRKRGLWIEKEGETPQLAAWEDISELVLMGGRYVSSSVIQRAMDRRIPIAFYKRNGEPLGLLLPDKVRSPSPTAMQQWEWARDEAARLEAARALVLAKIRNVRVLVHRRKSDAALERTLWSLETQATRAASVDALRGVEGQAAHAYFSRWPDWLRPLGDGFPGRRARGASDPVNVMLNYLYTQLFRLAHLSALSAGLDPYLGVLHEGKGRYAALAADLMEPFRFLVDRVVHNAVNHGVVGERDFIEGSKGPYKLLLRTVATRRLIEDYEELLARPVAEESGVQAPYREHLYRQALSLRRVAEGKDKALWAFRMKW
ncbi:MAG: CRISPR-associated endonuclease Cas1 [Myxococcales bacterium]|nr:MAG: CRISPR-associated endonuclease Cas1 [Myxococcales bacterium]